MIPALLITFREVIEATLIVATILGILTRLGQHKNIKTLWLGTLAASMVSIGLLGLGSLLGIEIQALYTGRTEEFFEGSMMVISAIFITWAVFWLHTYFSRYKVRLLQKVKSTIETKRQWGLFLLVFAAVFREGFEIVLFLSTIYLSTSPVEVFSGFSAGIFLGLLVSFGFFTTAIKLPVYRAFQTTSVLLILFAAGLLARGVGEFVEAGIFAEYVPVTIGLLPTPGSILGDLVKSLFGLTRTMDSLQLIFYAAYIAFMRWYVYARRRPAHV